MEESQNPKLLVRSACLWLCVIYVFTNVAFAHKPETNFWSERRKAIESRHPERSEGSIDSSAPPQNDKTLLAGLPANLQLPSPTLLPHPQPFSLKGEGGPLPLPSGRGTQGEGEIASILQSLPTLYGSVRNISVPSFTRLRSPIHPATFGDVNDSANSRLVIHIQDVHRNPEAQANISKTIQELINSGKVGLVALEGAFQSIDLSSVRKFPYPDSVKAVADYLLKEKKISGAVYAALTTPSPNFPSFVGVDDRTHYFANVEAYKKSAPHIEEYKEKYSEFRVQLIEKKKTTFNPQLLEFDEKVEAYRNGTLKVGKYAQILLSPRPRQGERVGVRGVYDVSPSIKIFLQALDLEDHLNFSQVEEERSRLLSQLVKKLKKDQISGLLTYSVAYRLGSIKHTDFYQYLKNLCREAGLDLAQYPSMNTYIQYVLLSDKLNPEKLIQDLQKMEETAYVSLTRTPQEQSLITKSKHLYLVGKLLDFALTPEEWKEYKTSKAVRKEEGIEGRGNLRRGQLVGSEENKEGSNDRPKLSHDKGKRPFDDFSPRPGDFHQNFGLDLSDLGFQLGFDLSDLGLQPSFSLSYFGFQLGFRLCDSFLKSLFSHFQNHLLRPVFNFIDYLNQRLGTCIRQFFPQYLRNSNDHNSSFEGRTHSLPQIPVPNHPIDLSPFESFYEEAQARDQAMVKNLIAIPLPMRERVRGEGKAKVIILVTGGFHSTGIDQKLKEAGITTISFAPKITHVDSENGSAYLSVFTQEKTPLDRLFQGEKLFLADPQLINTAPIPVFAAEREIAIKGLKPEILSAYLPELIGAKIDVNPVMERVITRQGVEYDEELKGSEVVALGVKESSPSWLRERSKVPSAFERLKSVVVEHQLFIPVVVIPTLAVVITALAGVFFPVLGSVNSQAIAGVVSGIIATELMLKKYVQAHERTHSEEGMNQLYKSFRIIAAIGILILSVSYLMSGGLSHNQIVNLAVISQMMGTGTLGYIGGHLALNGGSILIPALAPGSANPPGEELPLTREGAREKMREAIQVWGHGDHAGLEDAQNDPVLRLLARYQDKITGLNADEWSEAAKGLAKEMLRGLSEAENRIRPFRDFHNSLLKGFNLTGEARETNNYFMSFVYGAIIKSLKNTGSNRLAKLYQGIEGGISAASHDLMSKALKGWRDTRSPDDLSAADKMIAAVFTYIDNEMKREGNHMDSYFISGLNKAILEAKLTPEEFEARVANDRGLAGFVEKLYGDLNMGSLKAAVTRDEAADWFKKTFSQPFSNFMGRWKDATPIPYPEIEAFIEGVIKKEQFGRHYTLPPSINPDVPIGIDLFKRAILGSVMTQLLLPAGLVITFGGDGTKVSVIRSSKLYESPGEDPVMVFEGGADPRLARRLGIGTPISGRTISSGAVVLPEGLGQRVRANLSGSMEQGPIDYKELRARWLIGQPHAAYDPGDPAVAMYVQLARTAAYLQRLGRWKTEASLLTDGYLYRKGTQMDAWIHPRDGHAGMTAAMDIEALVTIVRDDRKAAFFFLDRLATKSFSVEHQATLRFIAEFQERLAHRMGFTGGALDVFLERIQSMSLDHVLDPIQAVARELSGEWFWSSAEKRQIETTGKLPEEVFTWFRGHFVRAYRAFFKPFIDGRPLSIADVEGFVRDHITSHLGDASYFLPEPYQTLKNISATNVANGIRASVIEQLLFPRDVAAVLSQDELRVAAVSSRHSVPTRFGDVVVHVTKQDDKLNTFFETEGTIYQVHVTPDNVLLPAKVLERVEAIPTQVESLTVPYVPAQQVEAQPQQVISYGNARRTLLAARPGFAYDPIGLALLECALMAEEYHCLSFLRLKIADVETFRQGHVIHLDSFLMKLLNGTNPAQEIFGTREIRTILNVLRREPTACLFFFDRIVTNGFMHKGPIMQLFLGIFLRRLASHFSSRGLTVEPMPDEVADVVGDHKRSSAEYERKLLSTAAGMVPLAAQDPDGFRQAVMKLAFKMFSEAFPDNYEQMATLRRLFPEGNIPSVSSRDRTGWIIKDDHLERATTEAPSSERKRFYSPEDDKALLITENQNLPEFLTALRRLADFPEERVTVPLHVRSTEESLMPALNKALDTETGGPIFQGMTDPWERFHYLLGFYNRYWFIPRDRTVLGRTDDLLAPWDTYGVYSIAARFGDVDVNGRRLPFFAVDDPTNERVETAYLRENGPEGFWCIVAQNADRFLQGYEPPRLLALAMAEMAMIETVLMLSPMKAEAVTASALTGGLVHDFAAWLTALQTRIGRSPQDPVFVCLMEEIIRPFYQHLISSPPPSDSTPLWTRLISFTQMNHARARENYRESLSNNPRFAGFSPPSLTLNWAEFLGYFAGRLWGNPLPAEVDHWIAGFNKPAATQPQEFDPEAAYQSTAQPVPPSVPPSQNLTFSPAVTAETTWLSPRMHAVLKGWLTNILPELPFKPNVEVTRDDKLPFNKIILVYRYQTHTVTIGMSHNTARQRSKSVVQAVVAGIQNQLGGVRDQILKEREPIYQAIAKVGLDTVEQVFGNRVSSPPVPRLSREDENRWATVNASLKVALNKWLEMAGSDPAQLNRIKQLAMRFLNEHFFIPRGFIYYPVKDLTQHGSEHETLIHPRLARILLEAGQAGRPFYYVLCEPFDSLLTSKAYGSAPVPITQPILDQSIDGYGIRSRLDEQAMLQWPQADRSATAAMLIVLNAIQPDEMDNFLAHGRLETIHVGKKVVQLPVFANAPAVPPVPGAGNPADIVRAYPPATVEPEFDVDRAYQEALNAAPSPAPEAPTVKFAGGPGWISQNMRAVLEGWITEVLKAQVLPFNVNVEFRPPSSKKAKPDPLKFTYHAPSHTLIFELSQATAQQTEPTGIEGVVSFVAGKLKSCREEIEKGRDPHYRELAKGFNASLNIDFDHLYRMKTTFNIDPSIGVTHEMFSATWRTTVEGFSQFFLKIWNEEPIPERDAWGLAASWYNERFFLDRGFIAHVVSDGQQGPWRIEVNKAPNPPGPIVFEDAKTIVKRLIPPVITQQPQAQTVDEGETATFHVTATGNELAYQWQKEPHGGSFADIPNATQASYTTPVTTMADHQAQLRAKVTNKNGSATSNTATLTVTPVAPEPENGDKTPPGGDSVSVEETLPSVPPPMGPDDYRLFIEVLWDASLGDLDLWDEKIEDPDIIAAVGKFPFDANEARRILLTTIDSEYQKLRDKPPSFEAIAKLVSSYGINPEAIAAPAVRNLSGPDVAEGWLQTMILALYNECGRDIALSAWERLFSSHGWPTDRVQEAITYFRMSPAFADLRNQGPGNAALRSLIAQHGFDPIPISNEWNVRPEVAAGWLRSLLEPVFEATERNLDLWPEALSSQGYTAEEIQSAMEFFIEDSTLATQRNLRPGDADMRGFIIGLGLHTDLIAAVRNVPRAVAQSWLKSYLVHNPAFRGRPGAIAREFGLTKEAVETWLNDPENPGLAHDAQAVREERPTDDNKLLAVIFPTDGSHPSLEDVAALYEVPLGIFLGWLYDEYHPNFVALIRTINPGAAILRTWLFDFMGNLEAICRARGILLPNGNPDLQTLTSWMTPADLAMAQALQQIDLSNPNLRTILLFLQDQTSGLTKADRDEILAWLQAHYPNLFVPDVFKPTLRPEVLALFGARGAVRYGVVDNTYQIENVEINHRSMADGDQQDSAYEVVPFSLRVRIERDEADRFRHPYLHFTHLYIRGADQAEVRLEPDGPEGSGLFMARGSLLLRRRNQGEVHEIRFFAVDAGTDRVNPIRGPEYTVRIRYMGPGVMTRAQARAYLLFLRDRLSGRNGDSRSLRIRHLEETVERIMLADFAGDSAAGFASLEHLLNLSREQARVQIDDLRAQLTGSEALLQQLGTLERYLNETYLDANTPNPPTPTEDLDPQMAKLPEFAQLIPFVDAVRILMAIKLKFERVLTEPLPPTQPGMKRSFPERAAVYELLTRYLSPRKGVIFNSPWDARVITSVATHLARTVQKSSMIVVDDKLMLEWEKAHAHLRGPPVPVLDLTSGTIQERAQRLVEASQNNPPYIIFITPEFLHQLKPAGTAQPTTRGGRSVQDRIPDKIREQGWNYLRAELGLLAIGGGHQVSGEAGLAKLLRDMLQSKPEVMKVALTRDTSLSGPEALLKLLNFVDRGVVSATISRDRREQPFNVNNKDDVTALHQLEAQCMVVFDAERVFPENIRASVPAVVNGVIPYELLKEHMKDLFQLLVNYLRNPSLRKLFAWENAMIRLFGRTFGNRNPKQEALETVVRAELKENKNGKFLIVARHIENIKSLTQRLTPLGALRYSGDAVMSEGGRRMTELEYNRLAFENDPSIHILITTPDQWGNKGDPEVKGITHIIYYDPPRNPHDAEFVTPQLRPRTDVRQIRVYQMTAQTNAAWFLEPGVTLTNLFREAFFGTLYEQDRSSRVQSVRDVMQRIRTLGQPDTPVTAQLIRWLQEQIRQLNESFHPDDEGEHAKKRPSSRAPVPQLSSAERRSVYEAITGTLETEQALYAQILNRNEFNQIPLSREDAFIELVGVLASFKATEENELEPGAITVRRHDSRPRSGVIAEFTFPEGVTTQVTRQAVKDAPSRLLVTVDPGRTPPQPLASALPASMGTDREVFVRIEEAINAAATRPNAATILRNWSLFFYLLRQTPASGSVKAGYLRHVWQASIQQGEIIPIGPVAANLEPPIFFSYGLISEEDDQWWTEFIWHFYRHRHPAGHAGAAPESFSDATAELSFFDNIIAPWYYTTLHEIWNWGDLTRLQSPEGRLWIEDGFASHVKDLYNRLAAYTIRARPATANPTPPRPRQPSGTITGSIEKLRDLVGYEAGVFLETIGIAVLASLTHNDSLLYFGIPAFFVLLHILFAHPENLKAQLSRASILSRFFLGLMMVWLFQFFHFAGPMAQLASMLIWHYFVHNELLVDSLERAGVPRIGLVGSLLTVARKPVGKDRLTMEEVQAVREAKDLAGAVAKRYSGDPLTPVDYTRAIQEALREGSLDDESLLKPQETRQARIAHLFTQTLTAELEKKGIQFDARFRWAYYQVRLGREDRSLREAFETTAVKDTDVRFVAIDESMPFSRKAFVEQALKESNGKPVAFLVNDEKNGKLWEDVSAILRNANAPVQWRVIPSQSAFQAHRGSIVLKLSVVEELDEVKQLLNSITARRATLVRWAGLKLDAEGAGDIFQNPIEVIVEKIKEELRAIEGEHQLLQPIEREEEIIESQA